ncbi:hypothetical protein FRC02_004329 [Tulasnella sp. 418]|nr:hypothetical protein FRC02_004329 [Tulasnella sp. 418]
MHGQMLASEFYGEVHLWVFTTSSAYLGQRSIGRRTVTLEYNHHCQLSEHSLDVTAARWLRFLQYTRLVRYLQINVYYQPTAVDFDILSDLVSLRGGDVFPQVQHMVIMKQEILDSVVHHWTSLFSTTSLRTLEFSYNIFHLMDKMLNILATCTDLRVVTCLGSTLTTSTRILPFELFDKWPNLVDFKMRSIRLSPKGIIALSHCQQLRSIHTTLIDEMEDTVLKSINSFSNLEELGVSLDFDKEGPLKSLTYLATKALRRLDIKPANVEPAGGSMVSTPLLRILEIVSVQSPLLETLQLIGGREAGFHELAPISRLSRLNHLSVQLRCTNLSDPSDVTWSGGLSSELQRLFVELRDEPPHFTLKTLAILAQSCPNLYFCHLSPVDIGDDVHTCIVDLPRFGPKLRFFDIRFREVPDAVASSLAVLLVHMLPSTARLNILAGPAKLIQLVNILKPY